MCVCVCVWVFLKQRRGVLVVVQNEIHSFTEGILWLSVGETEGGDRQIGGEAARRALISTEGAESRRVGGCAVPVET